MIIFKIILGVQISFEDFFGGPFFVNPSKLICTPNELKFIKLNNEDLQNCLKVHKSVLKLLLGGFRGR